MRLTWAGALARRRRSWMGPLVCLLAAGCGGNSATPPAAAGPSFQAQVDRAQADPQADSRARKLIGISLKQVQARDVAGAESSLGLAVRSGREIKDPAARAGVHVLLAKAQVKAGNLSAGKLATAVAAEAAQQVTDAEAQAQARAGVAGAQAAVGDMAAALATLDEVERAAAELADPEGQARVLLSAAARYRELRQSDATQRALASALVAAENVTDARGHCRVLALCAVAQHQMAQHKDAEKTFDAALEATDAIEAPLSRSFALAELVEQLSGVGDTRRANAALELAEKSAGAIAEPDMKRQADERIEKARTRRPR